MTIQSSLLHCLNIAFHNPQLGSWLMLFDRVRSTLYTGVGAVVYNVVLYNVI